MGVFVDLMSELWQDDDARIFVLSVAEHNVRAVLCEVRMVDNTASIMILK